MASTNLRVLLAYKIYKTRKRRTRNIYIRNIFKNRNVQGDLQLINELQQDPEYHHKYFRMSKETFDFLLEAVKDKIMKSNTHIRPISAIERLALTLRYLATGNSQISLAFAYRISPSSVSTILRECMEALCIVLADYLKPPDSPESWKEEAEKFNSKWQFPHCCGAIDGKHIRIKAPAKSGSKYWNYKNFFSIVLLAVVGANYEFLMVDIGASGSKSDGGILHRSKIEKHLEKFPPAEPIVSNGHPLPYVIIGDEGFKLTPALMRPYPGKYLENEEKAFNYRLSRARMVSENCFGILAAMFRIFHTAIHADLDLVKLIVRTAAHLHNFLRARKDSVVQGDQEIDGVIQPGDWREMLNETNGLTRIGPQGSNNYSQTAADIRNQFKQYFNENKLEWQDRYIRRGSA